MWGCGEAEGQRPACRRLRARLAICSADPAVTPTVVGLGAAQAASQIKRQLVANDTGNPGKAPTRLLSWVPVRCIIAEFLFQEMSEGRREKYSLRIPRGLPSPEIAGLRGLSSPRPL